MYDTSNLSQKLRELRIARYYKDNGDNDERYAFCKSQEKLAEKLGVERRTIMNWECGNSQPSLSLLCKLCDILDCNIDYFLGVTDISEIESIKLAAHYSNISPEIISYGLEHSDFLDCLNYFMQPKFCSQLFNEVTLLGWKKYQISQDLSEIRNPLKDEISNMFNNFYAITMPNDNTLEKYKNFLQENLPKSRLGFSDKCSNNDIILKESLSDKLYAECISNSGFQYTKFIDYLAHYTYKPLLDKKFFETQKYNLAKKFISLFEKYLSDIE